MSSEKNLVVYSEIILMYVIIYNITGIDHLSDEYLSVICLL